MEKKSFYAMRSSKECGYKERQSPADWEIVNIINRVSQKSMHRDQSLGCRNSCSIITPVEFENIQEIMVTKMLCE